MKSIKSRGKKVITSAFCRLGLDKVLLKTLSIGGGAIKVLVYHRIMEVSDPGCYPYDYGLIDANAEIFDRHMCYVRDNFDLIHCADVIDHLDSGCALPRRPLLITFDDGFEDNYRCAFPVLQDRGIPATVFVTTGYIGQNEPFWTEWLAFVVLNTPSKSIDIKALPEIHQLKDSNDERHDVFLSIMLYLRSVSDDERLEILAQLRQKYGDVYDTQPDSMRALSQPMTWDHIREMHQCGITIGSHTVSHPFLSRLGEQRLIEELRESKLAIEKEIQDNVTVMAYPNGQGTDYNHEVMRVAEGVGYKLALNYMHGVNKANNFGRYEMRRMHIPSHGDFDKFRYLLSVC